MVSIRTSDLPVRNVTPEISYSQDTLDDIGLLLLYVEEANRLGLDVCEREDVSVLL